jgi:predicted nucleic acid-binding protein
MLRRKRHGRLLLDQRCPTTTMADEPFAPTRFLDTSVVVRYLTGDPPEMAHRAALVVDGPDPPYLTDVVVIETAYARQSVVDALIELIQKANIALLGLDKGTVVDALLLCRPSGRISFGDAMIWAAARSAGSALVYSFDARFPTLGIHVQEPG